MEILKFITFRDGGTVLVQTDEGEYAYDGRIGSINKGRLYRGYPKKDDSNIIEDDYLLKLSIKDALENYNDPFYKNPVGYLEKFK